MLVTRYKLLVDYPGIPAGEIMVHQTGQHAYVGETHPEFGMTDNVVENDPTNFQFVSVTDDTQVVTTEIGASARQITKTQFLDRFTDVEYAGIMIARKSSVAIEVWKDRFDRHTGLVNLDSPTLIGGLGAMEAAGLLAAGRAAQILG